MYRCNDCEKIFEYTKRYAGDSGEYWGTPYTQYYEGCPYCKSEFISEIKYHCDICNFSICEEDTYYETDDGSIFCEDCITKKET